MRCSCFCAGSKVLLRRVRIAILGEVATPRSHAPAYVAILLRDILRHDERFSEGKGGKIPQMIAHVEIIKEVTLDAGRPPQLGFFVPAARERRLKNSPKYVSFDGGLLHRQNGFGPSLVKSLYWTSELRTRSISCFGATTTSRPIIGHKWIRAAGACDFAF